MSLAIALAYYVILIAVVGYWAKKRVKSAADFAKASSGLSWVMVAFGFTLIPLGAGHTISLWEAAPGLGASVMWWGIITGGIFLPMMMLWFGPWVRQTGLNTMPEIMEHMFGAKYARMQAGVTVATWTGIGAAETTATAVGIYGLTGGALPLFPWCILIALVLIVAYVYLGGMLQMVWLNIVNAIVMILGSYLAMFMLTGWLAANAGGWEGIQQVYNSMGQASWLMNVDFSPGVLKNIIIPVAILHCFACAVAQNMNSPFFAARTDADCRKGIFIGAGINCLASIPWIVMALCATVIPAVISKLDPASAAKVAPIQLALDALPAPIVGLLVISLLAATLSTGGATVMANANVLTNDIIKRAWRPNMSDKTKLKTMKISILICALLFAFPALSNAIIFPIFLWCFTFGIPVFVIYFMGLKFSISKSAAWITTLVAFAVNFIWTFATPAFVGDGFWSANVYPVTLVSIVLGVILPLVMPDRKKGLLVGRSELQKMASDSLETQTH